MAWETCKVEKQRLQLIRAYESGVSMAELAVHYGIQPKTGYKWYNRYLKEGEEGLKDRSRAPHNPHRIYTDEQINKAIRYKLKKRRYGPKKVLVKVQELYPEENFPGPTRLYEVFKEHHLVTSRRLRGRIPATAPLADLTNCNDTWAVDFKGWFLTGDGYKCEPLTITDCYSRYLIQCTHLEKHSVDYVWPIFDMSFREYGLPNRVRSDNGPPFGSKGAGRITRLSVKLIKAGVIPEWITPGRPEENGRHERFHLTLKQEVASPPQGTLALQMQAMNTFKEEYNFERPHEALDMKTPAYCYQASIRSWDGLLRPPEYDRGEMEVRKVCKSGCIWWYQADHFIGEALIGEYVGIKITQEGNHELYYGPVYLGKLTTKGLEKPVQRTRRQR